MPNVSMIIGESDANARKRAYLDSECKAWVRAALERGFDLSKLDDRDMRLACFNEMNKQIEIRDAKALREIPLREKPGA